MAKFMIVAQATQGGVRARAILPVVERAKASFRPTRSKGQCFLQDPVYIERIIEALAPQADETLIEIGPGTGNLTFPIARRGTRVLAIEHDDHLAHELELHADDRIEVVRGDATQLDLAAFLEPRGIDKVRVVGNLPYSVSAPILLRLLAHISRIHSMLLMFQKEVAERLVATPGTKDYGSLSVLTQQATSPKLLFLVPGRAFRPKPRVVSAVVSFQPRGSHAPDVGDVPTFRALVRALLAHRRKTIANNIKHLGASPLTAEMLRQALEQTGVDPTRRAETMSVEEFANLSRICTPTA